LLDVLASPFGGRPMYRRALRPSPAALLSVVLVIATAFSVAVVVQLVLPEVQFALALALGAVVAPPDAVAASAVGPRSRPVELPRGETRRVHPDDHIVLCRVRMRHLG
jgi:hypothetical protein